MTLRIVSFAAILFMGLSLIPSGAHLFALPNKIHLAADPYFTVQGIYAGWALLGILWFAALAVNVWLAVLLRHERPAFVFALIGALAIPVTLAIFFAWTFPANQATANWTDVPETWERLRTQWEYSHAVNSVVVLIGFCAVILAVLTARE
jgi:hypothetical protein